MQTYKIGVFGSSEGELDKILPKARRLGEVLGKQKAIVITGACAGLPYEVALVAKENGAQIWGYSQAIDLESQRQFVDHDPAIYDKIFYIPAGYEFASMRFVTQKYRNVSSTANCDAGIIISGRWGTANEFTNLHDMGKVIGILTGTGGFADELVELTKKLHKPGRGSVLIFNDDPKKLVDKVLEELEKRS